MVFSLIRNLYFPFISVKVYCPMIFLYSGLLNGNSLLISFTSLVFPLLLFSEVLESFFLSFHLYWYFTLVNKFVFIIVTSHYNCTYIHFTYCCYYISSLPLFTFIGQHSKNTICAWPYYSKLPSDIIQFLHKTIRILYTFIVLLFLNVVYSVVFSIST